MIALLATFLIINRNKLFTCGTEDFLSSPANQLSALVLIQCLAILYLMIKYTRKSNPNTKIRFTLRSVNINLSQRKVDTFFLHSSKIL